MFLQRSAAEVFVGKIKVKIAFYLLGKGILRLLFFCCLKYITEYMDGIAQR